VVCQRLGVPPNPALCDHGVTTASVTTASPVLHARRYDRCRRPLPPDDLEQLAQSLAVDGSAGRHRHAAGAVAAGLGLRGRDFVTREEMVSEIAVGVACIAGRFMIVSEV
jgi:hypothetical protein